MNVKKILLIGIYGTYNYGCEAIVRGTANQIRLQYPDAEIDYASVNKENDLKRLDGSSVNIIDLCFKSRYSLGNIYRKMFSIVGYTLEYCSFASIDKLVKKYDMVFSIGGDIYTLAANGKYSTDLSYIGNQCYKLGIPYVIWGCSIGPFDKNAKAEKYYTQHLKKVTRIVARENATIKYLKGLGISENVVFAPDPAFYVLPMEKRKSILFSNIRKIGLNLSPHSALYHYNDISETIKMQALEIDKLIDIYGYNIMLLPHVISPSLSDDDFDYLKKIYSLIHNKAKVCFVDYDPGFIGLKDKIKECDIVISARMHCNINSVTCGIPTVFLAYSQKAKGMVEFVYGDMSLLMNIKDFNADLLQQKMDSLLQNCHSVKDDIEIFDMKSLIKSLL